jgi:hypothetical protein
MEPRRRRFRGETLRERPRLSAFGCRERFAPARGSRSQVSVAFVIAIALFGASAARAQDSVRTAAGAEYGISGPLGWLDRWLFGSRYRALWTDTVHAQVLHMPTALGGLAPVSADTGLRSGVLNLRGPRDLSYTFRLSNPPVSSALPDELRLGVVTGPVQDLVSALHPGAPLVVPLLARSAGVADRPAAMRFLATDSALGALTSTFGEKLGFFESTPEPVHAVTTRDLIAELRSGGAPAIDARGYLRERLFDVYVGETELFPTEARWRRRGEPGEWTPEAHDRDAAFANFDGVMAALARIAVPPFMKFGPKYDGSLGETAYLLAVDRTFLAPLDSSVWDSAARAMQAAITDSAIAAAVAAMPPPWRATNGAELAATLRARRDALPAAARAFYHIVSKKVDLYAPDAATSVFAWRTETDELRIDMPGFHRVFLAKETDEVTIFLEGREQTVLVRGGAYGGPVLHVVTGTGHATIIDSSTAVARTLFVHDSAGGATVDYAAAGALPKVTRNPVAPPDVTPQGTGSATRPADGVRYGPVIWFDLFGNLGVLLGGGVERIRYERGYVPWSSRQRLRAAYATEPNEYAVEYDGTFRFQHSQSDFNLALSRSGIGILRFYGYGNETVRDQPDAFYSAKQVAYTIAPSVQLPTAARDTISVGFVYKDVNTNTDGQRFITIAKPFGYPEFREFGARITIRHDTRDSPVAAQRGWLLIGGGDYFPATLDLQRPFGGVNAAVSTYWTPGPGDDLTLAVRVAGQKIWGLFPVFEAAYIGGATTVRGLPPQRYAGSASLYSNLEARLKIAPLAFVVRWDFGVSAIMDAGRVFVNGVDSNEWHAGLGGGVWAMLPDRSAMLYLTAVHNGTTWGVDAGTKFIY